MPRSVNHVASRAKRKRILKLTRGYFGARKNVWTVAKNTWEKGLTYAYRDRRNKKRNFRSLWIQRINAAARLENMSYSTLMMSPILIGHMSPVVPRMKRILNTLLPITLPIAMPLLPFLAATTLVASSGIEVPPATMVRPITALDILND